MKKIWILLCFSLCLVGCKKQDVQVQEQSFYKFTYEGMSFSLKSEFTEEKYGTPLEYIELSSCAFEGKDKTYKYEHYEITTYNKENKDYILSIYLLDDTVSTEENVKITDEVSKMESAYGTNYELVGSVYTYKKDDCELKFYTTNDVITNIEYRYVV